MTLIVGLGNPGEKYKLNRHNVGFLVLEKFRNQLQKEGYDLTDWNESKNSKLVLCEAKLDKRLIKLLKPLTYMNESGYAISFAKKKYDIVLSDIYVIYDDLDIKLGDFKITKGKAPREHNGINDINEKLSSDNYWHIRIGIDNRDKDNRIPGERYVLQNFTYHELEDLKRASDILIKELLKLINN